MLGVVKFFKDDRGFGFITSGGKDYFVHHSDILSPERRKTLNPGQRVQFEVDSSGAKTKAIKVSGVNCEGYECA